MGTCARRFVAVMGLLALALSPGCGGRKADLALRLPEGAAKTLKKSQDLTSTTQMMGQNTEEKQRTLTTMTFQVQQVDREGVTTASVTTDIGQNLLDSMLEMVPKESLQEVSAATVTAVIGPKGDVRSVTGMAPVVEQLLVQVQKVLDEQFKQMPPQTAAMMGAQIDKTREGVNTAIRTMAGDEAVRKNLDALLGFYPAEPVAVGDRWSRTYEVMMPVPMQAQTEYTLMERGGGLANMDFKTTYTPLAGHGLDLGLMKMEFQLGGSETGSLQVSEETGWISAVSSTIDLTGVVDMGVMKASIAIQGTSYVDGG